MNLICLICFHSCPGFENYHLPRPHPSIGYILSWVVPEFPVIVANMKVFFLGYHKCNNPGGDYSWEQEDTPTQSTHIHIKLHQRYFCHSKIFTPQSTQPINLQGGAPYPAINETITPCEGDFTPVTVPIYKTIYMGCKPIYNW